MISPIKGRTIRYLGGGLEFLLLANVFFYLREKTIFFLAINVRQFFFYVSSKNFFVVCFPFHVGYHLEFFHQFRQQFFFSAHTFNKLLFSEFCGDKLFFSIFFYPPPDIKWCVPKLFNGYFSLVRYTHPVIKVV